MRSKLLLIAGCLFLTACADIKETGISRGQAITIAKQACPEYPNRFPFVDRVEWISEKGFWTVQLDDESGNHGRIYEVNRNGVVVGTQDFKQPRPQVYYGGPYPYYGSPYYDGPYYGGPYYGGPYYGPPVVVGVYGGGGYHHRW